VHRVKGKGSGDKRAGPERPGHFLKHREEQQRICEVQQNIYEMNPARIWAEQLTIAYK
jgi:hypothetical protein